MFEPDGHHGPFGAQRELVRPFHDDHRFFREHVFQAERFQIVKIADAVKVDVINRRAASVFVDQRESGARDFVFVRRAQPAGDAFRQRGLPCSEIPGKQDKNGRLQVRADFAPSLYRFFRRVRDPFAASHGSGPRYRA